MSIRVECSCGQSIQAENVFAGGQVKCACGRMVLVPLVDPKYADKIRFNCPHCNMRVLGKRSSIGKKSKCPACAKTYVIPEPQAEPQLVADDISPAGFSQRQRIRIEPGDIAFLTDLVPNLVEEREHDVADAPSAAAPVLFESTPTQVVLADETAGDSGLSESPPILPFSGNRDDDVFWEEVIADESAVVQQVQPEAAVPPSVSPVEIRIDLAGGRGRPFADTRPRLDDDKVARAQSTNAEQDSPFIPLRNDQSHDLERKTELPIDDDTIRTPTRPAPQPRSLRRNIPGRPSASPLEVSDISEHLFAGFADDPLPPPTIPIDELRLVDALPPTEAKTISTGPAARAADRGPGASRTEFDSRDVLDQAPFSTTPVPGRNATSSVSSVDEPDVPAESHDTPLPRPLARRQLASPPVSGASIYSPVARHAAAGTPASLVFVDGESAGQKIPMRARNFLIGRERDCHFRPKSASVSHHHCVLKTDDFSVRIRDLGSRNGTYVNGHRIHREVLLHHSDSIWIGDVRFKVEIPYDLYAGYHSADAQISLDEFMIF